MSLRLCSRAPEMTIRSEAATHTDSSQANRCSPGENQAELDPYTDMREKRRDGGELANVATRQLGLVTAAQLNELGFSGSSISRAVSAGRLHRLHQGVYAAGHTALSGEARCLAAALACGPGALVSHGSAAWLWGLVDDLWLPFEVVVPTPRRPRKGIRVRSATVRAADRREAKGVPVTSVPLTLLHMGATRGERFLGYLLGRVERQGMLDLFEFDSLLSDSAGYRGAALLRSALEEFREPVFVRSRLERRFRRLIQASNMPLPSTNYFAGGYELDMYWPKLRFAVELDTYDYHGDRRAFEQDRKRHEDLKLAGIEIVRITGRRLSREPQAVIDRLRLLLNLRARELGVQIHV